MDGGIALLASTDTYDIANGGININSNTLEQYNDATITGSSTTNVILVNGVEATITISIWISRYRLLRTMRQRVPGTGDPTGEWCKTESDSEGRKHAQGR